MSIAWPPPRKKLRNLSLSRWKGFSLAKGLPLLLDTFHLNDCELNSRQMAS